MLDHPMPPTTHTVEMAQLGELNDRLTGTNGAAPVTAERLGLAADSAVSAAVPPTAVLLRLAWDGPPEYPYVHGHFSPSAAQGPTITAEMHTAALRELSHLMGLNHHRWGV